MEIKISGKTLDFTFPENLAEVCINVLDGDDYPILKIPDLHIDVIIDVGANAGSTSLYFLNNYPQARIFSFEPSRTTFEYLKKNTMSFSNIFCYNYALGSKNDRVFLHHGKEHCAQNSIYKSGTTSLHGEMVLMRKASEVISELGVKEISILKLDTEGSELPILSDIYPKYNVKVIYIEYHSEKDRIRIDRLLQRDYFLAFSKSTKIHRGRIAYILKSFCNKNPQLYYYRIPTP